MLRSYIRLCGLLIRSMSGDAKIKALGLKFIYPIPSSMTNEVLKSFESSFYLEEPMNEMMEFIKIEELIKAFNKIVCDVVKENLSIAVLDNKDKVVAACLNGAVTNMDSDYSNISDLSNMCTGGFEALRRLNAMADIFDKFQAEKLFDVKILSVQKSFRGRNLAYLMIEQSEKIASCAGFKIMKTDATSFYSQRIFEKCGWQTMLQKKYSEMNTICENFPWKTIPPHESIKIMAKCIDKNKNV